MASKIEIPDLPASIADFLPYLAKNKEKPIRELLLPYRQYDTQLRQVFAQEPDRQLIQDPVVNVVPIFAGHETTVLTRARKIDTESDEEKQRYVMPLQPDKRLEDGAPAIQTTLKEYQGNFHVFSEGALADMDWSNVVVAGSAAVTPLMPVPKKYQASKRMLRKYYHEIIAPASDVDLFLYGLSEEEAFEKIKQIEANIRDAILSEATVVRTKYAITIASQYPTRHIQIVLRVYKSVSEILTGFDVDCACAAYDGKQVYASPRALAAYITQINEVDLSRRSPSYENRLSKYSRRGFEVYWANLDRTRVDPTIFERNFPRTVGLARLLVLEGLPSSNERDEYIRQRRVERGRPPPNTGNNHKLMGNIKGNWEDEIAEWVDHEEVSNYHTFTVPYGPRFNAKKIEKLLYTKDLLLNAEWNAPKHRDVTLHRHPAFFGRVKDVINDCCCECPVPVTIEEKEVAKKEAEIYISGPLKFIVDNPGRQQIGSFNPLTEDDWTEMAYVSDTARLCHAIVGKDVEAVDEWFSAESADPNLRDYTGRTPLHLAAMTSTPEVLQCLIGHGARIVARLADGQTALHIAAARGETAMIKILLDKSEENEEEEAEKEKKRRAELAEEHRASGEEVENVLEKLKQIMVKREPTSDDEGSDSFDEVGSQEGHTHTAVSAFTSSFVHIESKDEEDKDADVDVAEDDPSGPDVYTVDVLTWDSPCSPLHLAILNGHLDAVKTLVEGYAADVMLPVKVVGSSRETVGSILPLVIAMMNPGDKVEAMTKLLLDLGATPAQANKDQQTPLLFAIVLCKQLIDMYQNTNAASFAAALDFMAVGGTRWSPTATTPVSMAVLRGDVDLVRKLLALGAKPDYDFSKWVRSVKVANAESSGNEYDVVKPTFETFEQSLIQPVVKAVTRERADIALELVKNGAQVDALAWNGMRVKHFEYERNYRAGETLLDVVKLKRRQYQDWLARPDAQPKRRGRYSRYDRPMGPSEFYLKDMEESSYQYWSTSFQIQQTNYVEKKLKKDEKELEKIGFAAKIVRVELLLDQFKKLEEELESRKAKTFEELCPEISTKVVIDAYDIESGEPIQIQYRDLPFTVSNHYTSSANNQEEAYIALFEAAWTGDTAKIQELTMAPWGPKGENDPLEICVFDEIRHSPFGVALLRGHRKTAEEIFKIGILQYEPLQRSAPRYSLRHQSDDDDDDETDCSNEDDSDLDVRRDPDDGALTIDITEAQDRKVRSTISPFTLFESPCRLYAGANFGFEPVGLAGKEGDNKLFPVRCDVLAGIAIQSNSFEDLNLIYSLGNKYQSHTKIQAGLIKNAAEHSGLNQMTVPDLTGLYIPLLDVFERALESGNQDCIAYIVEQAGQGSPLSALLGCAQRRLDSAAEKAKLATAAPDPALDLASIRFYQGLIVYGKKRKDWAARGAASTTSPRDEIRKSLSVALLAGLNADNATTVWLARSASAFANLFQTSLPETAELLGDKLDRVRMVDIRESYLKFMTVRAKKDGKYGVLSNPVVKIEKLLGDWLDQDSHLLMHAVIIGSPQKDSPRLLEYLLKRVPHLIDVRTSNGWTPLMLAFALHRLEMAKILIDSNANQALRDNEGRNLVHLLTFPPVSRPHQSEVEKRLKERSYNTLIELIDSRIRPSMFTERCMTHPGSLTPLQWAMLGERSVNASPGGWRNTMLESDMAKIVTVLLEYSAGEELEMVNGAGDGPLHTAVLLRVPAVARVLVEKRPTLVMRENAVGRTPPEIVKSALTNLYTTHQPLASILNDRVYNHGSYDPNPPSRALDKTAVDYGKARAKRQAERESDRRVFLFEDKPVDLDRRYDPSSYDLANQAGVSLVRLVEMKSVFEAVPKEAAGLRKLVTLHEANEVAKRLAARTQRAAAKKQEEEEKKNAIEKDENDSDSDQEDGKYSYNDNGESNPYQIGNRYGRRRTDSKMKMFSIEKVLKDAVGKVHVPDAE